MTIKGTKFTDEHKKKMSLARIGIHLSEETKKRISESKNGSKGYWTGKKRPDISVVARNNLLKRKNEKHPRWKGDSVGYVGLHMWVKKWKGKANHCENCGLNDSKTKYQWANVDHQYRRVLEDFISMCISCHCKYDIKNNLKYK